MNSHTLIRGLTAFACLAAQAAWPAEPILPSSINQSVIESQSLSNIRGMFALNMAAGDSNIQANVRAIALAPDGGVPSALALISQTLGSFRGTDPTVAVTRIEGDTFTNATGVIGVNQASGVANVQGNSFALGVGLRGEMIGDNVLAESFSTVGGLDVSGKSSDRVRSVSVDDTAFRGARGVVQLNQSAGSGNSSANSMGIRIQIEPK